MNSLFHIPNYSFIHEKRKTNHKGGGLGIYVHKTLDYKILPNLAKNTENIETFTIEIENKNSKNILISAVYRPPRGNQSKFLEEIEQVVRNSKHSTKSFFLVGDLNLRLRFLGVHPLKTFPIWQDLTEQELEEAVVSLKPNKNPGCDSIHVNVIKAIYEELKRPLFYIFYQSLKSGIFPDKLKIAKVFPIYKSGKKYVLSNYRRISVLPCF